MDHEFTRKLGAWLQKPAADRTEKDLQAGALMLLQLNGNQYMYRRIMLSVSRYAADIEYQLQKYYNFRVQKLTHAEVRAMQQQAEKIVASLPVIPHTDEHGETPNSFAPSAKTTASSALNQENAENAEKNAENAETDSPQFGQRSDHDQLPEEIQALWAQNLSIMRRIRTLHEKLNLLTNTDSPCPDSERYPYLKEMIELDKQLHRNYEQYDNY